MPSLKYIKNKTSIKKWVKMHREQYNVIQSRNAKKYYLYKQQAKIFRRMLINLI